MNGDPGHGRDRSGRLTKRELWRRQRDLARQLGQRLRHRQPLVVEEALGVWIPAPADPLLRRAWLLRVADAVLVDVEELDADR